jgi:Domain of unknown function (DUF3425)
MPPVSLQPTGLQLMTMHHPWLDFFPAPRLRDNLIRASGDWDDELLCIDMIGFCNAPSDKSGIIFWREPWGPRSWEVASNF